MTQARTNQGCEPRRQHAHANVGPAVIEWRAVKERGGCDHRTTEHGYLKKVGHSPNLPQADWIR